MSMALIKDVTEFVLDGTHGSPERTEVGVPVLSAQNVRGGRLDFETDRYTSTAEYDDFRKRLPLAIGDVLLTIVGTIGRAAVVDEIRPLVFQRSVAVLRPKQQTLTPRFLYHVSQSRSFQAQLSRSSNQSSQAGVYLGRLKELRIPLPSLPEQRRIAEILDKADALRAKRRAALAQLDTLIQSIFLDMFGDPSTNPKGWSRQTLTELGAEFRYGSSNKSAAVGKPALRIPNVVAGSIDVSNLTMVPVTEDEFERLRLRDGDLLFVRTNGNPEYVGRCAVFLGREVAHSGFPSDQFIFASYLIRARLPAAGILQCSCENASWAQRGAGSCSRTARRQPDNTISTLRA